MFCARGAAHNGTPDGEINSCRNKKKCRGFKNFSVFRVGEKINCQWNNYKHGNGSFFRHVGNEKNNHSENDFFKIILLNVIKCKFQREKCEKKRNYFIKAFDVCHHLCMERMNNKKEYGKKRKR